MLMNCASLTDRIWILVTTATDCLSSRRLMVRPVWVLVAPHRPLCWPGASYPTGRFDRFKQSQPVMALHDLGLAFKPVKPQRHGNGFDGRRGETSVFPRRSGSSNPSNPIFNRTQLA